MSGWTRVRAKQKAAPVVDQVTAGLVTLGKAKTPSLRVSVPVAIADAYAIDPGDTFIVKLDGAGRRLRFEYETGGDVTAKSYSRGGRPARTLHFVLNMLIFDAPFGRQMVAHDKVDGDLVITLPEQARAA